MFSRRSQPLLITPLIALTTESLKVGVMKISNFRSLALLIRLLCSFEKRLLPGDVMHIRYVGRIRFE